VDFLPLLLAISYDVFHDIDFQRNLAEFLEKASIESIKKFGRSYKQGKSSAFEPRDVTDPALITGMLITLLEGIGQTGHYTQHSQTRQRRVRWKDSLIPGEDHLSGSFCA